MQRLPKLVSAKALKSKAISWTNKELHFFGLPSLSEVKVFAPAATCVGNDLPPLSSKTLTQVGIYEPRSDPNNLFSLYREMLAHTPSSDDHLHRPLCDAILNTYDNGPLFNLYPLGNALLRVGGATPIRGFKITDLTHEENRLAFPFPAPEAVGGIRNFSTIVDLAVWWNVERWKKLNPEDTHIALSHNPFVMGVKIESSLDTQTFHYAPFVAQLLVQANSVQIEPGQTTTAFGMHLHNWTVRIATLTCNAAYMRSLREGTVDQRNLPQLILSHPYDLLKVEDRRTVVQVLQARHQQFLQSLGFHAKVFHSLE